MVSSASEECSKSSTLLGKVKGEMFVWMCLLAVGCVDLALRDLELWTSTTDWGCLGV